ncbi:MAG: thymidine phosphorylase [bacterium]|nr:thymidine phosphorylase [bacterium]
MNIIDIITKKKNKQVLNYEELKYAFNGYLNKEVKDYQMSALLMAITINGMTYEETLDLTDIFIKSGDVYKFDKPVCDKHSTGGIGDTVTLIIAPIVAALNVPMAKMSGKGLGITGGTIDKLESIPGFNVNLTKEDYHKGIKDIGLAVGAQTEDLVPLDKVIYALRDVTGTTESIPLIASSIMSKKIACGATYIVIDIKCGEGALIKTEEDAKELSEYLIKIGTHFNRKVKTLITSMDEPLSNAVGNALEVLEAKEILETNKQTKLRDVSLEVAANIVSMAKNIKVNEAKILCAKVLENQTAYKMFEKWISYQHGDLSKVKASDKIIKLKSNRNGTITKISALKVGKLAGLLGAGRKTKEDKIDYSVGIKLLCSENETVTKGQVLALLYVNDLNIKIPEEDLKIFEIK